MKKITKLKKLVGATVSFLVNTPTSGEGELTQLAVVKILEVKKATNDRWYVTGLSLKRLNSYQELPYRQFSIDEIHNGTLAIIGENEWTLKQPQLRRIFDGGFPKPKENKNPFIKTTFKRLELSKRR